MTMVIGVKEAALEARRLHRARPRPATPADEVDELLAREVRRLIGAPVPVVNGVAEIEGLRIRLGEDGRLVVEWNCVFCGRPVADRPVRELHELGEAFEARERFCAWCPGRSR